MIELVTAAAAGVPMAAGWSWHALRLRRRIVDARRDPLTGLATRTEFEERATRSLLCGPRAVVVLDLDGFKQINDMLGHAAGDEVIRAVGGRLTAWADQHAGIVARLGGDEFAAVLPVLSYADLDWTMDGLAEHFAEPVVFEGEGVPVDYSAGVVWCHPRQAVSGLAPWLRRADEVMYQAKVSGGGWHLGFGPDPALPTVNGRRQGRLGSSGAGEAA
ncbi:GGDEF domain-containing protein [Streptomyces olivoreticuli]|uniref:GGDEF domain-containing protein n=1 Tax=Streptomyces olivoreticuli TaxID=68246 RepID=UPI0026594850|nr:GGDEF domain-containing protein [Streptomyces olivoreticuli]WKK27034.1 GGDEF domain-containing protein [Streptomyces olivoreticuli]